MSHLLKTVRAIQETPFEVTLFALFMLAVLVVMVAVPVAYLLFGWTP